MVSHPPVCLTCLLPIRLSAGGVSQSLESDMPMELTYLLAAEELTVTANPLYPDGGLVHQLDVGHGDCHDPGCDLGASVDSRK